MTKLKIKDSIFKKSYGGIVNGIRFQDLPKDLEPTDLIDIEKVEGYYSENNSWDAHTILTVYREREETQAEYEKREASFDKLRAESKTKRYEQYKKLKEEFEP